MRWLLRALQPTITAMLMVESSTLESSSIQAIAPPILFVFIKQTNGLSQCRPSPPPGCCDTIDAAVRLMQAMLAPECLSPSPSRTLRLVFIQFFFSFFGGTQQLFVHPYACQDDVRTTHFFMAMTTSSLTSATSASRSYHLHVVLVGFYSSHNIHTITMLQLRGMSARRILPSAYSSVSPSLVLPL
jgi:hypothetical protein